ncbi:MAG: hypothetical protein ABEJ71_02755 [Halodesulfurarchaeum sp.]
MSDRAEDIRLDPNLVGGSLMDADCYALSTTRFLLGEPDRVQAASVDRGKSGVDTALAGILEYAEGLPIECEVDGEVHRETIEAVVQYRREVDHFAAVAGETDPESMLRTRWPPWRSSTRCTGAQSGTNPSRSGPPPTTDCGLSSGAG